MDVPSDLTDSKGRIEIVQVWRFLAATAVVVAHAYSRIVRLFPGSDRDSFLFALKPTRTWGHFGVDLFFVISGFIMVWTNWGRFGCKRSVPSFLAKRIARVVPIYWFATSIAVFLLIFEPQVFSFGQRFEAKWVSLSYFFVPTLSPDGELFSPVLGLGWTLNYEMYFYLIFGVCLIMHRRWALLSISVFFLLSAIAGSVVEFHHPVLIQDTSWILMEFVLGMGVAALSRSSLRLDYGLNGALFYGCIFILISTIFIDPVRSGVVGLHFSRFVFWGIPCAGLLFASLRNQHAWLNSGFGHLAIGLGNASYSIYLFQIFALPAVGRAMRSIHLNRAFPIDALILGLAAGSIIVGYVAYIVIERPLSAAAHRLLLGDKGVAENTRRASR